MASLQGYLTALMDVRIERRAEKMQKKLSEE